MQPWDILPSVKKATPAEGAVVLDGKVALAYPDAYAVEARLLSDRLYDTIRSDRKGLSSPTGQSTKCSGRNSYN